MRRNLCLALAACFCVAPVAAQFVPVGPAVELTAVVSAPVAVLPDGYGGFLVPWAGHETAQAPRYDLYGRPRGAPIAIDSTGGAFFLTLNSLAAGSGGSLFAAWQRRDMGWFEQFAMVVGRDGLTRHEWYWSQAVYPPVAAANGHDAYTVCAPDGEGGGLGSVVLADGQTRIKPFRLDGGLGSFVRCQTAAIDLDGSFALGWSELFADQYYRLHRRFDPQGVPLGPVQLGELPTSPAVDGDGGFVRASSEYQDDQPVIVGQRFTPQGAPDGPAFEVSRGLPVDGSVQADCDVAGNCVFAWRSPAGPDTMNVYARRVRRDNTFDGPAVLVDAVTGRWWSHPQVGVAPGGDFLVAWWVVVGTRSQTRARGFRVAARGDFDGDRLADLVLRQADTGATRLWLMNGSARAANLPVWPETPDDTWDLAGADDFDGDRRADLVFRNRHDGEVMFLFLDGAGGNEVVGQARLVDTPSLSWDLGATGDFDADGWPDLVWSERATGRVSIWTMKRGAHVGTRAPTPDRPDDPAWRLAAAQDWNGDGRRDLLWRHEATGALRQWLLDEDWVRTVERPTQPAEPEERAWEVVAAADYGPGPGGTADSADVVWRHAVRGRQVIWYLDPTGVRTAGVFTAPAAPGDPSWALAGPR
jgi:hypothetical protein